MPSSLHSNRYQVFRAMLVAAREKSGLTQVEIANRLGKPQSFISKSERGERRLDFTEFLELANLLQIDVADFISRYQTAIGQTTLPKIRKVKK
ncbi:MAG: helix-turn-helix transcriptional regulator [Sterolibacterium sp.]|nr:helix-turn-helix transcriptional regulator [Sterolibacterium sp.]